MTIATPYQTVLPGTSVTFTATPENGGNSPTYQWKLNGNNVGSNSLTYTNNSISNGDVVGFVLLANNTCQTSATATSNNLTIKISDTTIWNGTTWSAGAPTSTSIVIVAGNLTESTPITCKNLTVDSGKVFVNNSTLIVTDNPVINGSVTGTGNLVLGGSSAQTISGTGVIEHLTINNPSGAAVTGSLSVSGELNIESGTLNTGGNLTLLSDSNGTARVGTGANLISGDVTVQRYIPAKTARKYSFLGCPVITSIRNGWQQQIYITGAGTGGAVCGTTSGNGVIGTDKYNSNGFDATLSNGASMFTYNAVPINGSRWLTIPNTNQTNFTPGIGYKINIRGDRNSATVTCNNQLNSGAPTAPEAVTLKATGRILTGNVEIALNNPAVHKYTLLANPYTSQISYTAFQASNPNINNKMWTYSPYGNSNYTTYSAGVIANGASGYDNTFGDRLAMGQAFYVEANSSGTVVFQESHKVNGRIPNNKYFGTALNKIIRIGMKSTDDKLLDEVVLRYNPNAVKGYDSSVDAVSLSSASQTLSILKDSVSLAIATMPDNKLRDTTHLGITSSVSGTYKLFFSDYAQIDSSVSILLRDKFLNTTQDIRSNQIYNFNITSDTLSKGKNRFELISKVNSVILPVKFISVNAVQDKNGVTVNWKIKNEQSVTEYAVESSADGVNFTQIAQTKATGANNYNVLVENPTQSITHYRIKANDNNGSMTYSNIVKLTTNHSPLTTIGIYPNPLVGTSFNLILGNVAAGKYKVSIFDKLGKIVYVGILNHSTNSDKIDLGKQLASGSYTVSVLSENGTNYAAELEVR